jgi:hypothetical protein
MLAIAPDKAQELEEIDYYGTTYRLSVRQKLLREAQMRKSL